VKFRWPWTKEETEEDVRKERDSAMEDLDRRIEDADRKLAQTQAELRHMPGAVARARKAQTRADAFTRALEGTYRRPQKEA
jgi:prefoldin subunit 5